MTETTPTCDQPFDPKVTALASFALAPLAAGAVHALNDRRLGLKDRVPLSFYLFFFLGFAAYLVLAKLHAERVLPLASRDGWLFGRAVMGVMALAASWPWCAAQRRRFAACMAAGVAAGRPWPWLATALAAGVAFDLLVWQMFFYRSQ